MSNTAKLQLGFSPLTKKIHLAKMKDVAPGVRVRVGNDRGRDVTDEAAQLVWQLVMAEGGEVAWQLKDGIRMVLKAEEVDKEPAPARYEFDEPALNIAQKIMECRATAAVDGWPDVRLKAAIQCLVIEAMKWAAPAAQDVWTGSADADSAIVMLDRIDTTDSDDDCRIEEVKSIIRRLAAAPAAPEGWKLVPIEPTAEMMLHKSACQRHGWDDKECSARQTRRIIWGNMLAAAPARGGDDECSRCGGSGTIDYPQGKANVDCPVCEGTRKAAGGEHG